MSVSQHVLSLQLTLWNARSATGAPYSYIPNSRTEGASRFFVPRPLMRLARITAYTEATRADSGLLFFFFATDND